MIKSNAKGALGGYKYGDEMGVYREGSQEINIEVSQTNIEGDIS